MRDQDGFSLVELLIVVAIIFVIAAITVPYLVHSRMSANEGSAVASVRTILTAELSYNLTYPDAGFAQSLAALGPTDDVPNSDLAGLIDSTLVMGHKNGYDFTLTPVDGGKDFKIEARPQVPNLTGTRLFCADSNAVIYYSETDTCSPNPTDAKPVQ